MHWASYWRRIEAGHRADGAGAGQLGHLIRHERADRRRRGWQHGAGRMLLAIGGGFGGSGAPPFPDGPVAVLLLALRDGIDGDAEGAVDDRGGRRRGGVGIAIIIRGVLALDDALERGVPVVLDGVVCPAGHFLGDLGPAVPEERVELEELGVLGLGPGALLDARVEVVEPPLAALLPRSALQGAGDGRPRSRPEPRHQLQQPLVLVALPRSPSPRGRHGMPNAKKKNKNQNGRAKMREMR